MLYALIDCNNFYASCEIVFNPKLKGRPVVVLSNNDGCVIARSKEAKEIGIQMGIPVFKIKDIILRYDVYVASSNFGLYGDMSYRVMETLKQFSPQMEIYSIDEAFLGLDDKDASLEYLQKIRATVLKWTGIPISIGIAPTKTLAKAANYAAKKKPDVNGVFFLVDEEERNNLLKELAVEDVWGIGGRTKKTLNCEQIYTAWQLIQKQDDWIRRKLSVVGLRTVWELRGIPCIASEENPANKKTILCSRTFSELVTELDCLAEIVSTFVSRAVEKARRQGSAVSFIQVFIATSPYRDEPFYTNQAQIELPQATNYTPELISCAKKCLSAIFRPGHLYKRAGVLIGGLVPEKGFQQDLFSSNSKEQEKRHQVMQIMDTLNSRFGKSTIRLGAEGVGSSPLTRQAKGTKRFTTRWDDLLTIRLFSGSVNEKGAQKRPFLKNK